MTKSEPTFQEVMDKIFQHLDLESVKRLNSKIKPLIEETSFKDNYKTTYENFLTDYEARKRSSELESMFRIYEFAWEQILLLASLQNENITVENFSFKPPEDGEKDLLISFNEEKYHIEVTSKRDIKKTESKKKEMIESEKAVEIDKDIKIANSNLDTEDFHKYLKKHFTITDVKKVLFYYNLKGSYYKPEILKEQLGQLSDQYKFNYVMWNNLLSTEGRRNEDGSAWNVLAWHNFPKNDEFCNTFLKSIEAVLKELKMEDQNVQ